MSRWSLQPDRCQHCVDQLLGLRCGKLQCSNRQRMHGLLSGNLSGNVRILGVHELPARPVLELYRGHVCWELRKLRSWQVQRRGRHQLRKLWSGVLSVKYGDILVLKLCSRPIFFVGGICGLYGVRRWHLSAFGSRNGLHEVWRG